MVLTNHQKLISSQFVKAAQRKMFPNQGRQHMVENTFGTSAAQSSQNPSNLVYLTRAPSTRANNNSFHQRTNPAPRHSSTTQSYHYPNQTSQSHHSNSVRFNFNAPRNNGGAFYQQSRVHHTFYKESQAHGHMSNPKRKLSSSPHDDKANFHEAHKQNTWIPYDFREYPSVCPAQQLPLQKEPFAEHVSTNDEQSQSGLVSPTTSSTSTLKGFHDSHLQAEHRVEPTPLPSELLERKWINFNSEVLENIPSCSANAFSVVSYNILAQKLLRNNSFLYNNCNPDILQWEYRWKNIKLELEHLNADVLCLQEVENRDFQLDIKPWLMSHGYNFSYKKRSGNDQQKPDGVLTACRSDKFRIISTVPVEYYRKDHYLTIQHNVGLILMLKMINPNVPGGSSYVCVGNTHLLYNPKRGDIKLVQLATFFAEMHDVLRRHQAKVKTCPPLVICGDFNSTPTSPLVDFVRTGSLNYDGLATRSISGQHASGNKGSHILPPNFVPPNLNISDRCTYEIAYAQTNNSSSSSSADNNCTDTDTGSCLLRHELGRLASSQERYDSHDATTIQDRGITVDYIFYTERECEGRAKTSDCPAVALKLNGRLGPSTGEDIARANSLPNSAHSSDHLPVVAQFQLCP